MSDEYGSRQERRKQKTKLRFQQKGLWKKILVSLCIVFLLVIIGCGIATAVIIHNAPTLKASELNAPLSTRIYDKDGKLVSTVFHQENRVKVHLKDVPKTMQDAVISIEDKRFYHHHGVDFHRLFGAIAANIKGGWGAEGGSTITQQVVKRSVLSPEKTLTRKIQEAWLALKLERKYSKDQILEMYLNNVYYGHGAYGLKTAAKTYFGEKDLSKLNVSQMALLAGLPNSPSADDPFKHPKRARERRNQVLSAMVNNNAISKQQADKAKAIPIGKTLVKKEKKQKNNDPYNAFVDTLYEQLVKRDKTISEKQFFQGGLKIYTTLDPKAQRSVYHLIRSGDIPYPDKNFETGLSLVDTKSGAIRAVGGGRNFKSISYTNYGSHATHHPGSIIKPVLDYGPAIEHLNWPTSHTLTDEHYQYSDGTSINEWDNKYWGDMSIRRALQWSRNIPALKAFQAVGKDKAQHFAKGLGINIDPIYESAAIGGFDGVTPLQMAEAYAAFGNGGVYHEAHAVDKITFPSGKEIKPKTKSHTAMHDYTAYMTTDMLKTVISSGTGTKANISGIPIAGKTGSTNIPKEDRDKYGIGDGLRDSWFAGYTTQYSLAIWTGYPSFHKNGDVQYIKYDGSQNIAQQLFRQLMSEVSAPNTADFKRPDSVASSGSELYVTGAKSKNVPSKKTESSDDSTPKKDQDEQKQDKEKQHDKSEEHEKKDDPKQVDKDKDKEDQKQEDEDKNKEDQDRDKKDKGQENKQHEDQSDQDEREQDKSHDHQNKDNGDDENKEDHDKGEQDSGDHDSGDDDSSDQDPGDHDSGDQGSSDHDSGDHKSDDQGSSNHDSGDHESDDQGSSDHDSGDHESDDQDSGNHHSGDHKSDDQGNKDNENGNKDSSSEKAKDNRHNGDKGDKEDNGENNEQNNSDHSKDGDNKKGGDQSKDKDHD